MPAYSMVVYRIHTDGGTTLQKSTLALVVLGVIAQVTPASSDGDVVEGEKVFQRCISCHSIAEVDPNKKGPTLKGIVGRPIASVPGYSYSTALVAVGAKGTTWDAATLDQFLAYPTEFAKGTTMTAPPVRREKERADVIAYLGTLH
jgi:cytochrome c